MTEVSNKPQSEWYSETDIPESTRQGEIVTRHDRDWSTYETYSYEAYVPTQEEQDIIDANLKRRKEHARQGFFNVPDQVKESVGRVIDNAMNDMSYAYYQFDKINVEGMKTVLDTGLFATYERHVEKPTGPGEVMSVNTRGLVGGTTRPNAVEKMKHKSIVDGFDMMFPKDAMVDYMNQVLSQPFMHRDSQRSKASSGFNFDAIVRKADSFVGAMIDVSGLDNNVSFKARTDFDDDRKMLDRNNTKTPDNIHVRNVLAIQEFASQKPEYIVALYMWVHAMGEYCRDLKSYVREEMGSNQQEIAKDAPFWDAVNLVEGGNLEAKHFYDPSDNKPFSKIDGHNKLIPTTGPNSFFMFAPVISSVMGALLEESGIDHHNASQKDIKPSTVEPALDKLVLSGIFQRGAGTQTSPVLIRCPFAKKLKEMLTLDLVGKGDASDSLFMKFVEKVREDLNSKDMNASQHMDFVITDTIRRVNKSQYVSNVRNKLDAHDAAKKGGCPMHRKLG